jgi:hypothetical protein
MSFIQKVVAYLKAHWVTILALLTAIWAYAGPTVLDYVHNHPKLSFWYGLVGVIVAFYLKSGSVTNLVTLGNKS